MTARRTATGVALLIATALAIAGCSSSHPAASATSSASTTPASSAVVSPSVAASSPSPPVVVPSSAPASTAAAASSPVSVATPGAVPSGFSPESVTFVSAQTGFALGQVPCTSNLCYGLATTTDGGHTWSFGGDLPMAPQQDQPVTKVRFADATNGWVFGPQLWSTHDAGKSWHQLTTSAHVFDVEASAGLVYLVGSSCAVTATSCATPAKVMRAAIGSDAFAAVPGATMTATSGQLALHGKAVWVVGATPGTAYLSSSDGNGWRKHANPCPQGAEPSSLTAIAPVTATTLYLLCAADPGAGSETKLVLLSTDGGATAHQTAAAPDRGGIASGLAAASAGVVAVSAQSGASWIYRSGDAGATWASAFMQGDGGLGITDLGFTTSTQGVAIYGTPGNGNPSKLLMSRDAGATWVAVTF